jgi:hypothetical protein
VGCASDEATSDVSPEGSCSKYPRSSRTDDNGTTWYWWYLHWQSVSPDLDAFCATFGDDAMMVVEVDFPQNPAPTTTLPTCSSDEITKGSSQSCAVAGAYRFEAACRAGELLFELPSDAAFHGNYHVESTQAPGMPRHTVNQDVHCTRDLFITAPSQGPITADGGGAI